VKHRACRISRPPVLRQPLLKAHEGPILDRDGENEPAQQVAEVIGDDAEEQPHLVGPEAVTGEPSPVGRGLALLDPLLGRAALVVEAGDRSIRAGQRGDDEADPRESSPR
jgi:hypothetical protein